MLEYQTLSKMATRFLSIQSILIPAALTDRGGWSQISDPTVSCFIDAATQSSSTWLNHAKQDPKRVYLFVVQAIITSTVNSSNILTLIPNIATLPTVNSTECASALLAKEGWSAKLAMGSLRQPARPVNAAGRRLSRVCIDKTHVAIRQTKQNLLAYSPIHDIKSQHRSQTSPLHLRSISVCHKPLKIVL